MNFTFLFSKNKGFWSIDDGWVATLGEATITNEKPVIQIRFKNTHDVGCFAINDCLRLSYHEATLLLNDHETQLFYQKNENMSGIITSLINQSEFYAAKGNWPSEILLIPVNKEIKCEKAPLFSPLLVDKRVYFTSNRMRSR